MEAAMAELHGSEAGVFCAAEAMRIFGGCSCSNEHEIERCCRDAMPMCIAEGTNEILQTIIARPVPRQESGMNLPLEGVRVLAVEQHGAGPFGRRTWPT